MKRTILSLLASLLAAAALALTGCAVPEDDPTAVQPPVAGEPSDKAGETTSKATAVPVKLTAKRIAYPKAEFSAGQGPHSCVKAVVTNQTRKNMEVNPFYFGITGTDGEKRQAAVGVADGEFDTLTLAPAEKASGVVCAKGSFRPKVLTFTNELFSEAARAQVG